MTDEKAELVMRRVMLEAIVKRHEQWLTQHYGELQKCAEELAPARIELAQVKARLVTESFLEKVREDDTPNAT
jgi:hypothetical protein